MVPISEATQTRLEVVFPEADWGECESLLTTECGDNLPLVDSSYLDLIERIRFAVLKLSEGEIGKLRQAIDEAKCDWRDVLVWAGFGEDPEAHWSWSP